MLTLKVTKLRPFTDGDIDVLSALRNDLATQTTLLALPRPSGVDRVRAWATQSKEDHLFFVVADAKTNASLGFVQLAHLDLLHGTADLGIALHDSARGKGHGRSAIALVERFGRDTFRIRKISLTVLATNEAAIGLYRDSGYETVGTRRAHFYSAGRYHDVLLMEKQLPVAEVA